eukprot:jgi/Bigna1/68126/fgenesh1_pg.5_\
MLSTNFSKLLPQDYCIHCRQPAARASERQWKVLMQVAQRVSDLNLIPSRIKREEEDSDVEGKLGGGGNPRRLTEYRARLLAFTVLDYGYDRPAKNRTPGIPLHQDTSCLGEAIGSLHIAGETKNIDLLFDHVSLNGKAAGRVVSFAHTPGSFYVMKDHSRWLARHRVKTTKSLGLLLRVKYIKTGGGASSSPPRGGMAATDRSVGNNTRRNSSGRSQNRPSSSPPTEGPSYGSSLLQRLLKKYEKRRGLHGFDEEANGAEMWMPDPTT